MSSHNFLKTTLPAFMYKMAGKKYITTPQTKDTIDALWRLEKIILDTLDFNQAVQKIVDSVLTELGYLKLGYRIVVLALVDHNDGQLKRISISQTTEAKKALEVTPVPFHDIIVPLSQKDNYLIRAIDQNTPLITHDWFDILRPSYTPEEASRVQEIVGIKTSMVYPVLYRGKPEGVLIFSLVKSESEVSEAEKDLIRGFTDVVGLAVQNSRLYSDLESTTQKLAKANEDLKALDKLKDEFVSLASHELRTPMTAIKSYTWMVLNGKAGALEPKATEYLSRVYQSTDRLLHMVNEMLDISRIESGRVQIHPEAFDIAKLASDVQAEFFARAQERQLTLTIDIPSPLPVINGDREKIHQVLENIIGNAFKFTPPGGTVTAKFISPDPNTLRVEIHDTGVGIKAEDIEKLFKKFSRLDNNLVVNAGVGTGLGLFICKQYVEIHSGAIGVESIYGHGTTFWFTLPMTFTLNPSMVATVSPPLQTPAPAVDLKGATPA